MRCGYTLESLFDLFWDIENTACWKYTMTVGWWWLLLVPPHKFPNTQGHLVWRCRMNCVIISKLRLLGFGKWCTNIYFTYVYFLYEVFLCQGSVVNNAKCCRYFDKSGHRGTQTYSTLQLSCRSGFGIYMLWARKHCFGSQTQWMIHCRLDSSPQFARDYLMTEVDIFSPTEVNSWADIGQMVFYELGLWWGKW